MDIMMTKTKQQIMTELENKYMLFLNEIIELE